MISKVYTPNPYLFQREFRKRVEELVAANLARSTESTKKRRSRSKVPKQPEGD